MESMPTEFAPSQRADHREIARTAELLSGAQSFELFDAIPNVVMILNEHRQVVFVNNATVSFFGLADRHALNGMRLGEALNCVHAMKSEPGCGTTSFCRECGAVKAMLRGLYGEAAVEECRISTRAAQAFDFRVSSSPCQFGGQQFVIFSVIDISHEKRRQVLERVFFHDFANTLASVMAGIELMPHHATDEENELAEKIAAGVYMLVDELKAQQSLLNAEDGHLFLNLSVIRSLSFLQDMVAMYKHQGCALDKVIVVDKAVDVQVVSDRILLSRIIGNMLKNALEASSAGDTVRLGCHLTGDARIEFWVQNAQLMPSHVQLQVFNRSFSTKGTGRGIGTYSMKLLAERYLNGHVDFTSSPEGGTVFRVIVPISMS